MADGRARSEWGRQAALQAQIANMVRDKSKSKPYTANDFDPTAKRSEPQKKPTGIEALKIFVPGVKRKRKPVK